MGKTSKWIRNLLTGKKERTKEKIIHRECVFTSTTVPSTPKEKRRWSFRRSSATGPPPACAFTLKVDSSPPPQPPPPPPGPPPQPQPFVVSVMDNEDEQNKNVSTAEIEEFAAVKIQSCYRSHLARKALRALRGLVKLQALVRGHLVRKQATATLRCMQALITLQAKAREQRIRMIGDSPNPRTSIHKTRINNLYRENEENIKIVEMDIQSRLYSPAVSALTEMSPRAYSNHFEDVNTFNTAQSSPQCFSRFKEYYNGDTLSSYDYPLSFPNYMANTQSSKAKARSQSAPKQRPAEIYEKSQMSGRRRSSMEAPRNNGVPRAVRMQRSSSQLGSNTTAKESQQHHHQYYPWMAIKLDRSNISLMESECGSTSTIMTNTNNGRHVDVQGTMCTEKCDFRNPNVI